MTKLAITIQSNMQQQFNLNQLYSYIVIQLHRQIAKIDKMGNRNGQQQSYYHSRTAMQLKTDNIQQLYSFVCETYDESLGKLTIYRKKQYNFDYVAVAHKIIDNQQIQHLKKLLKIYDISKGKLPIHQTQTVKMSPILSSSQLWLQILALQSCKSPSSPSLSSSPMAPQSTPIKIYFQYYNYTLKNYLQKSPLSLSSPSPQIGPELAYILACILDCYMQLKTLKKCYPVLNKNISLLVNGITNPQLIYLNIQGGLRFLPLPIFGMGDGTGGINCLACCGFDREGNGNANGGDRGRNVVIPNYGNRIGNFTKIQELDKTDKLFMTKFKRFIRFLRKQLEKTSTQKTQFQQSKTIPSNHLSVNQVQKISSSSNSNSTSCSYWNILQNANNIQEFIKILKQVNNISSCLQLFSNKDMQKQHAYGWGFKQQKIKLQKYAANLRNRSNTSYQTYGSNTVSPNLNPNSNPNPYPSMPQKIVRSNSTNIIKSTTIQNSNASINNSNASNNLPSNHRHTPPPPMSVNPSYVSPQYLIDSKIGYTNNPNVSSSHLHSHSASHSFSGSNAYANNRNNYMNTGMNRADKKIQNTLNNIQIIIPANTHQNPHNGNIGQYKVNFIL